MKIGLPGWFNVYTDALRDRVAENLGDLGGTIYNVANNAIDDTGKYVASALLDQAFNMGIGGVALDVIQIVFLIIKGFLKIGTVLEILLKQEKKKQKMRLLIIYLTRHTNNSCFATKIFIER